MEFVTSQKTVALARRIAVPVPIYAVTECAVHPRHVGVVRLIADSVTIFVAMEPVTIRRIVRPAGRIVASVPVAAILFAELLRIAIRVRGIVRISRVQMTVVTESVQGAKLQLCVLTIVASPRMLAVMRFVGLPNRVGVARPTVGYVLICVVTASVVHRNRVFPVTMTVDIVRLFVAMQCVHRSNTLEHVPRTVVLGWAVVTATVPGARTASIAQMTVGMNRMSVGMGCVVSTKNAKLVQPTAMSVRLLVQTAHAVPTRVASPALPTAVPVQKSAATATVDRRRTASAVTKTVGSVRAIRD
jgi:hypothetical protein